MERETNTANSPPSLSDAMEKIMAHPELISMVASVLGAPEASPATEPEAETVSRPKEEAAAEADGGGTVAAPTGAAPEWLNAFLPLLSGMAEKGKRGKPPEDPRSCLLLALRPYVSGGRQEAIDYMIRLSQISDLLKHLT